jgi:rubrerythrin
MSSHDFRYDATGVRSEKYEKANNTKIPHDHLFWTCQNCGQTCIMSKTETPTGDDCNAPRYHWWNTVGKKG